DATAHRRRSPRSLTTLFRSARTVHRTGLTGCPAKRAVGFPGREWVCPVEVRLVTQSQAQMPAGHIGRRAGGSTCPYAYSCTLYTCCTLYTSRKVTTAPLQRLACRYGRPSVQHHGARIESGALWNP